MDIRALPRFRGPTARKSWGEEDGHGKKPSLRMRDYVALAVILVLLFWPIYPNRTLVTRDYQRRSAKLNWYREDGLNRHEEISIFRLDP